MDGMRQEQLIEELTSALKETSRFVEKWRISKEVRKNQMICCFYISFCWFGFIADVKIVALKIVTRSVHGFAITNFHLLLLTVFDGRYREIHHCLYPFLKAVKHIFCQNFSIRKKVINGALAFNIGLQSMAF
jgi:hypothetical protein